MWVLLSSRLRTWLLVAVAVPVIRAVIRRARAAARRRGPDGPVIAALSRADSLLTRFDRRRRNRDGRAERGHRSRDRAYRTRGAKGGWL